MLSEKNQNALLNLLVEPLKVIISSRGEECDSKVHHNISKVNKSWEGGSGQFFFHVTVTGWNVPCSMKWGMGRGARLTYILQHSLVAEWKYKSMKYNEV